MGCFRIGLGLVDRLLDFDECDRLLADTPYKGLVQWAKILYSITGNFFLDNSYENVCDWELPNWDRDTVENLTRQWQEYEAIFGEATNMAIWLEEDPAARFEELLKFILERR